MRKAPCATSGSPPQHPGDYGKKTGKRGPPSRQCWKALWARFPSIRTLQSFDVPFRLIAMLLESLFQLR